MEASVAKLSVGQHKGSIWRGLWCRVARYVKYLFWPIGRTYKFGYFFRQATYVVAHVMKYHMRRHILNMTSHDITSYSDHNSRRKLWRIRRNVIDWRFQESNLFLCQFLIDEKNEIIRSEHFIDNLYANQFNIEISTRFFAEHFYNFYIHCDAYFGLVSVTPYTILILQCLLQSASSHVFFCALINMACMGSH